MVDSRMEAPGCQSLCIKTCREKLIMTPKVHFDKKHPITSGYSQKKAFEFEFTAAQNIYRKTSGSLR